MLLGAYFDIFVGELWEGSYVSGILAFLAL